MIDTFHFQNQSFINNPIINAWPNSFSYDNENRLLFSRNLKESLCMRKADCPGSSNCCAGKGTFGFGLCNSECDRQKGQSCSNKKMCAPDLKCCLSLCI